VVALLFWGCISFLQTVLKHLNGYLDFVNVDVEAYITSKCKPSGKIDVAEFQASDVCCRVGSLQVLRMLDVRVRACADRNSFCTIAPNVTKS
jgi:hypothetical protein